MKLTTKIISSIISLFVVILINFLLPRMMPGDPVIMLTGQDEAAITKEMRIEYEQKLGLDKSITLQFYDYIRKLSAGDLGFSYHNNDSVANLIKVCIPTTLMLSLPAIILSAFIAAILGCIAGYKENSSLDNYVTTAFIFINAVPTFLLAMILVSVFSFKLNLFPLGGIRSSGTFCSKWESFIDYVWHTTLPILTITIVSIPMKYMVVRNSVAEAKNKKYVIYAKARGVSDLRIKFIHILKNVSQPFITVVGLNLGFVISGSMITEIIFSINGMGRLIYDAAIFRDYPTLQGCFFIISVIVIVTNILTDLICVMIDPMQRIGTYNEE